LDTEPPEACSAPVGPLLPLAASALLAPAGVLGLVDAAGGLGAGDAGAPAIKGAEAPVVGAEVAEGAGAGIMTCPALPPLPAPVVVAVPGAPNTACGLELAYASWKSWDLVGAVTAAVRATRSAACRPCHTVAGEAPHAIRYLQNKYNRGSGGNSHTVQRKQQGKRREEYMEA
jgi:hypothetical protein